MSLGQSGWQGTMARVAAAARASGRDPATIRVLAVSKTFPAQAVRAIHALGQRAFGENYVQEAAAKQDALAGLDLEWHLIGPLQSNKTRIVAERFQWVHTVDRLKVAERLAAARDPCAVPLNVLVQVNISGETSKSGVAVGDALALAGAVASLPGLLLRGFMGIAAPTADACLQRAQFASLRRCLVDARGRGLELDTLSMGMSGDLEAAIAEGATIVRIGTAIFGERAAKAQADAAALR